MITISHLSKTYINPDGSQLHVLKDVNCEIGPGEVISIIGPSGTGKSTLLRALNLLDPPTGGSIMLDGEDTISVIVSSSKSRAWFSLGTVRPSSVQ